VLETPKGKELKEDVVNLRTLRRLIASPTPSSRAQARDLTNFGSSHKLLCVTQPHLRGPSSSARLGMTVWHCDS